MAMGSPRFLSLFHSLLLLLFTDLTLSQLNDVYYEARCSPTAGNFTVNSRYETNLERIISQFSSIQKSNYGFLSLSAGNGPDMVNSIALCRGDVTPNECRNCLNYTAANLKQLYCPRSKEATAWSEVCFVRYANRKIYGNLENDPRTCVYNTENALNTDKFNRALSQLLNNLSSNAAAGGRRRKYAAGNAEVTNFQNVFATVQCTPDLSERFCATCLEFAKQELSKCCSGRLGCRILRPNCVLRFESNPFVNQTSVPQPCPRQQ